MATSYGNTFTDLQAGINAAQALDYQRANAQDEANTRRAVARMQQRGQQAEAQARAEQQKSQTALALAQLLAQQGEASAGRQSMMDRERYRGETDKEIEKMRLDRSASAFDPRAFSTIAEIEAANNEKQQKFEQAQRLSATRKQWVGRLGAERAKAGMFESGSPDKNVIAEAEAAIKSIDTQAAALEMGLAPDQNGGFIITPPTMIKIPAMLNRGAVSPITAPAAVSPISPVTLPVAPPAAIAPVPAEAADFQAIINNLFGQNSGLGGFNPAPAPAAVPARRQRFQVDQNFNLVPVQ